MAYDDVVASVRKQVQSGLSVEGAVVAFRSAGLTLTQSMKALMEVFGISLGEAKAVAASHPVWAEVAKAAEPLHDGLETVARKGDKDR